jgi:hypothetical protein
VVNATDEEVDPSIVVKVSCRRAPVSEAVVSRRSERWHSHRHARRFRDFRKNVRRRQERIEAGQLERLKLPVFVASIKNVCFDYAAGPFPAILVIAANDEEGHARVPRCSAFVRAKTCSKRTPYIPKRRLLVFHPIKLVGTLLPYDCCVSTSS